MKDDRASWPGRVGVAAGLLAWGLSVPVLAAMMQANEEASHLERTHGFAGAARSITHLHATAVVETVVFIALQITSLLLLTFTLRAAYRLRTAVCFTVGAAVPMLLDGLGLFALLVWLRLSLGAG